MRLKQPRSQGLSSSRPLEREKQGAEKRTLSPLAPGGGKMRDPGNEVASSALEGLKSRFKKLGFTPDEKVCY